MWKSWFSRKNYKRQWNPKTQNVDKQVKTKMKKNQTLKPTGERIWMGWLEGRTHHSLMKCWITISHQNSVSYNWSHMTVPRIAWITSNDSRCWCYYRWPQARWCVGHSQQHQKEQSAYGSAIYPQELLQILNNSTRVLFVILLGGKDTKSQLAIFSTLNRQKRNH